MRTIWLTDIHLEFLNDSAYSRFLQVLGEKNGDAVLISGDIAQAPTVTEYLAQIAQSLAIPIYFVLGNHDFYHGSISSVRDAVKSMSKESPRLHWLTDCGPVHLNSTTCLVGRDGWGDARLGDYDNSTASLSDFFL